MKKIIAIALVLIMSLSIMTMAVCAAPDGLDSLAVVGSGIPGVAEWDPADANGNMTEVSEGIFEKVLDCPAGTSMKLKIAGNDAWVDSWNFGSANLVLGEKADLTNGGGSADMPLTIAEACKIKITVDVNPLANGGAATILVDVVNEGGDPKPTDPTTKPTDPTTKPTQPAAPSGKRVLTIEAPAAWSKVYIYTWEPASLGDFPGSEVQKSGNAFKAEIENSLVNLVVSGRKADDTLQQTDDIKLETNGKNVTIKIADDGKATVSYEGQASNSGNTSGGRKPAAAAPQGNLSNYRVVGDAAWMGSWDAASNLGQMIDMGNGVYRKNFDNVAPGSYALKITKDGKWDNAIGVNGNNFTFTVDQKCTITVDFNANTGAIEVYGTGVPGTADISMLSVVVLLALASVTAVVLVVNKKKFI
jgi:hypothetical protein